MFEQITITHVLYGGYLLALAYLMWSQKQSVIKRDKLIDKLIEKVEQLGSRLTKVEVEHELRTRHGLRCTCQSDP